MQHSEFVIHPDYVDLLREAGLDSFDALMSTRGEKDLQKPHLAKWRQRIALRLGSRRLYLKRYGSPPIKEQIVQLLSGFPAAAAVEWHWLGQMQRAGISAAQGVAYGYRRQGLLKQHSLLVTAEVPGRSLERWVLDRRNARLDRRYRTHLATSLADLTQRLHGNGLIHRDLYLSHVFFQDTCEGSLQLSLIDLARMIRPRIFRRRWIVKDLASLNYSTASDVATSADRVRWYKRYQGIEQLSETDRELIRAIAIKTTRIARHDAKRMND